MRRKVITGLIVGLLTLSLGGCSWVNKAYEEAAGASLKVNVLKAPTAVGMIKMMEPNIKPNPKMGDSVYYQIEQNPDELYAKLQTGEIEIATIPTEIAAKLYNDGAKYQIAAINTGGFMYVLSGGVEISNWSDLKGQEVVIADKGGAYDTIFRYLLLQNGINPDTDLTLEYIPNPEEQAQLVINGDRKIAVLPEPWVSMVLSENDAYKIALDIQKEWIRINGMDSLLAQTCLVVKSEVVERNHEEFSLFLEDFANSVDWVNKNSTETAKLVSNHDIGVTEKLAVDTISRTNLVFVNAEDANTSVKKYLQMFIDLSPDLIGRKMPDENFYYQK